MTAAPLPSDEAARLLALEAHEILDTPPEAVFDRLTRLASTLLEMPIALVSLVDRERQWFKSRVGLGVTETPREVAFCAHALLDRELMEVTDARLDSRFADNPLVSADPNIRFYAGVPLHTEEGHALGTLCVIDRQPRHLDARGRQLLTDLAAVAMDELRLRRTLGMLHARQESVDAELSRARRIMDSLFPSAPQLAALRRSTGVEAAGIVRPCDAVGGDYWTVGALGDGRAILVSADVAGHGIGSALQAAALHATLQPLPPFGGDLHRMQAHLERRLGDFFGALPGAFATLCYVVVDPDARTVTHLGAGTPGPMLLAPDGTARHLSGRGLPFGMPFTAARDIHVTPYQPGEILALFSDALTESRDRAGAFLEAVDLPALFETGSSKPVPSLVQGAMARFLGRCGAAVSDDATIVCARLP